MSSTSTNILQNCKLTYFNIAARGEATRLALTIGGIKFQDERIPRSEWNTLKNQTPWGSLPLLSLENGQTIAQQRSILRFVGKHVGLYPIEESEHMRAAHIDSIMDAMEDIFIKLMAEGQGLEQIKKEQARMQAVSPGGTINNLLMNVENFVKAHGSEQKDSGYCYGVGNSLSIADLFIFSNCGNFVSGLFDGVPLDALDKGDFPTLTKIRKTVRSQPAVLEWYKQLDLIDTVKIPSSYGPFHN